MEQITKKYDKKVVGLRQVGGVMLEPMKPLTKKMLEYTHGQVSGSLVPDMER